MNDTSFNFNSDILSSFSPASVNNNNKLLKFSNLNKLQLEKNKKR